jgi:ribosomal protein L37AE/L43A
MISGSDSGGDSGSDSGSQVTNPKDIDFAHGRTEECYICKRYNVKCLYFNLSLWICAKCFPWWLQSQRPTEVHHHAAPYVPRLQSDPDKRFDRRFPDLRKRC